MNGQINRRISAYTTNRVTGDLEVIDWNRHRNNWRHLQEISFASYGSRLIVDMLIGLDQADLHYSYQDVRGAAIGDPIARLTPLGWTCVGVPSKNKVRQTNFVRTYFVKHENELNDTLRKFWEIEQISKIDPESVPLSVNDKAAVNHVQQSLVYENGAYQVSLPWKPEKTNLTNNYDVAVNRLQNLNKKLNRQPEIREAYADTINKYIEKGYIREVPPTEPKPPGVWYLPHFPVLRPDKSTTKTRIVFDASAKSEGVSLNDVIYQGPKLQRDLFDVLLRFRKNAVALVCDIAEMYLRIKLDRADRPYHRFLWQDVNKASPTQFEFSRVVFCVNASPFLAQFVSQEHARKYADQYPRAAETVLKSTFMDDSMDSVVTADDAVHLYTQLSELWGKAGMCARKWLSNSPSVLEHIPPTERAPSQIDLNEGDSQVIKTLGVTWIANDDVFTFNVNGECEFNSLPTKRNFLKKIATVFDPLGFIAPFTVRGKMLMQDIWSSGSEWDDLLCSKMNTDCVEWLGELSDLNQIRVPRCLHSNTESKPVSMEIHTFVDASQNAYGAVSYSRALYQTGETSTCIIAAKSKVAPLKSVSIPRLELMAAVVGLHLSNKISAALEIPIQSVQFWSDSMDVLYWIRNRSRVFKPFIANRIGEIHSVTEPSQWRYVPTGDNPADMLSRGLHANELSGNDKWFHGPSYLRNVPTEWPCNKFAEPLDPTREQRNTARANQSTHVSLAATVEHDPQWRLSPHRFSSWFRLTRVHAWINRFISNCKSVKQSRKYGELQPEEISDAETMIITACQQEAFRAEYTALTNKRQIHPTSKLLPLSPIIDEDGVLRSDTRIKYAEYLTYDARFPIVLPRKHHVTKLIVRKHHEVNNHAAGTNHLLSIISNKYWILNAREEIREMEKECGKCARRKAKNAGQKMAPLPDIRLKLPLRAFDRVSVDFAGPFITKQGRGKRREKRYLCLFTCLVTRAVHLEMAYGLDTDSFINAFYRMVNRRGLPSEVLSDNGTYLVGAVNELKGLIKNIHESDVTQRTSHQYVTWYFNPPAAPHFGGVHESMIKSAKRAVYAILKGADVNDEELMTALTGAEALINSRPLTYQSAHPQDHRRRNRGGRGVLAPPPL